jgi:hypothetical protein
MSQHKVKLKVKFIGKRTSLFNQSESRICYELYHSAIIIPYTLLAVNIYMFVATNVGVAGDTINNIYIITYYTEEQIYTYFTLKHLYA